MSDFNVGDKVEYVGGSRFGSHRLYIGKTGTITEIFFEGAKAVVRWDKPDSEWPEDATAWPLLENLREVS